MVIEHKRKMDIIVGPMADRPKNRIRGFVEGMLKAQGSKSSDGENHKERPDDMVNLSLGDPTALGLKPPKEALLAVRKATEVEMDTKMYHGYQHSQGNPDTRKAIAKSLTPSIDYESIYITSGCSQALQFAITLLASEGKNILIPKPCFPLYNTICEHVGIEMREYPLIAQNGWEADIETMEKLCDENTVAVLICNPGNPTSHCYNVEHLTHLCKFAHSNGLPIIADEVYAYMNFSKASYSPLADVALNKLGDSRPPILSCGAISKRYLVPGWRMGWLAVYDDSKGSLKSAGAYDGLRTLCQLSMSPASILQAAVPDIIEQTPGTYHRDLQRTIEDGANYCVERCMQCPGLVCPSLPQGAMYFMPKIQAQAFASLQNGNQSDNAKPIDLDWCTALLQQENVLILPGTLFGSESFVRIVAAAKKEQLKEAWDRIERFCKKNYQG